MFIVYHLDSVFKSWDYLCTLKVSHDSMYSLISIVEEYDGYSNQGDLLLSLVENHHFIGVNVIIYMVEDFRG